MRRHALNGLIVALALAVSGGVFAAPKAAAKKGVREKHITREATLKSKDQSKLDFDSVDIGGERKTPMGTLINQNKADKNYDFVKVRLRWHPEMVQSASSLDTGNAN
jgi:hypothetical protein